MANRTPLEEQAELLNDLLDQAADVFNAQGGFFASVELPSGLEFRWKRGFFIGPGDGQELRSCNLEIRQQAADAIPHLFSETLSRRAQVERSLIEASERLAMWIRSKTVATP